MHRGWIGIAVACWIPASVAGPQTVPEDGAGMVLTVFGAHVPIAQDDAVGLFIDDDGHACVVEVSGVSCIDADGEEVWGRDVAGVRDVRVADDGIAVLGPQGWSLIGPERPYKGGDGEPVVDAGGRMAWRTSAGVRRADGSTVALPGFEDMDVILHAAGQIGVIDDEGALIEVDAQGRPSGEPNELELGRGGWLQTEALTGGGFAALDEDGLVIVGDDGGVRFELDVAGNSLHVVDDGVWIAGDDGLLAVTADGRVDVLFEGPIIDAASAGSRWAVLDEAGRIRVFDGDEAVGGVQHEAAIRALAPRGDGGVASVDVDGRVLVWSAQGDAREVPERASDVAWDAKGGLWLATDSGLVRIAPDGRRQTSAQRAHRVVAVGDGIVAGDGARLVRVTAEGEVMWESEEPHEAAPQPFDEVLVVARSDGAAVLDVATGVRRRRVVLADQETRGVGVAVGGLVAVARDPEVGGMAGFRPGRTPKIGYQVQSLARMALSPDGRWVAWADDVVEVRNLEGWPMLARATRPDDDSQVSVIDRDPRHVWIGRDDGRIERWTVEQAVSDTEVPQFVAYAQLDGFTAAPELDLEPRTWPTPSTVLAARPDGTVATGPDLALLRHGAPSVMPVLEPAATVSALDWDRERGWLIGTSDGRLLRVGLGSELVELGRVDGPITDVCGGPDGVVLAGRASVGRLSAEGAGISPIHLGAGKDEAPPRVACHSDGAVHVDLGDRVLSILPGGKRMVRVHPGGSRSVALLPTGDVVTGGVDEVVIVWDPARSQPMYVLEGHGAAVTDLAISADGERLIAGTAGAGAVVWDLLGLAPLGRLRPGEQVHAVDLDADGSVATVASQQGIAQFTLVPKVEPPPALIEGLLDAP